MKETHTLNTQRGSEGSGNTWGTQLQIQINVSPQGNQTKHTERGP